MERIFARALCSLFCLTLSAALFAQGPPANDPELVLRSDTQRRTGWAKQWLVSVDSAQIAWGAWLARRDQGKALTPLLIKQVEEYQPSDDFPRDTAGDDRHDALLVVLDALIGLDAVIPADQARKLYPEFPAQSLILLLRSRNNGPALLDVFHMAKTNSNWLAAGNALAKIRFPGFASILLSRFTEHLTVFVITPQRGAGGGMGSGGGECGFSPRAPKTGWPPVGLYELTNLPERDYRLPATLLVGGRTPVYYWRVEPGNYDNPPDDAGYCDWGNRDEYRSLYLNELLPTSPTHLAAYPNESIEWHDEPGYRAQLQEVVEKEKTKFYGVLTSLQQSGELNADEARNLQPRLEIIISDSRTKPSTILPDISDSDLHVPLRSTFTRPLD